MDDIYREHIIDHYSHPKHFGDLARATVVVKEANASCGDMFELALELDAGNTKIIKARFKGVGCAISTAAFSLLTERIMNHELGIGGLKNLSEADMVEMLGIPVSPTRLKCATLPLRAVRKALKEVE